MILSAIENTENPEALSAYNNNVINADSVRDLY